MDANTNSTRPTCTCGGTAPGFPQHEPHCFLVTGIDPDIEPDEQFESYIADPANDPGE